MDEPTAALGVKETAQVLDLIRRLKADGKTVILVSHNMADVVAVATRVAIFKSGRKVIDRAGRRARCGCARAHGDDGARDVAESTEMGSCRQTTSMQRRTDLVLRAELTRNLTVPPLLPASSSASISRCTFSASRPLTLGSRLLSSASRKSAITLRCQSFGNAIGSAPVPPAPNSVFTSVTRPSWCATIRSLPTSDAVAFSPMISMRSAKPG